MKRFHILLMAMLAMFVWTGCDNNNMVNEIEIEFEDPMPGSTVADASRVEFHIHFTSTDELHDIEIKLHPDNDVGDLILDEDIHSHEMEYIFEDVRDLSAYPAGTKFHLEVEVCADHDCSEVKKSDMEFFIP